MYKKIITMLGAVLLLAIVALPRIGGVIARDIGQSVDLECSAITAPTSIEQLTQLRQVVKYLQTHHRLPDFYITNSSPPAAGAKTLLENEFLQAS